MVFSDLYFLFVFLPAFLLSYLVATAIDSRSGSKADRLTGRLSFNARNIIIVVFSLLFYAWGEPVYVFLLLFCVLLNWLSGLAIDRATTHRRTALAAGLTANLLVLGTFKYAGFLAQTLCDVGISVPEPAIALPIGISFYTFQSISYLVDVYRRQSPVQHSYGGLLLYISMFPQLIAGPIVHYDTVASEIHHRHTTPADLADGVYRFLIGLGKKVILANQLSEVSDQLLGTGLSDLSTAGAWIGISAFTLQIYFDFSGYSDMAIGLGRCMGFHFPENFNHPYCCTSITEFWRRWHMSLGSFFRDYVYIPMGGNRNHQALNILVVWFLTGMWHGASWNFILWGLYFGLIVMLEKYTLLRVQHHVPTPLLHLYSMLLVVAGWGIFYFDDMAQMSLFFSAFFGMTSATADFVTLNVLGERFWLWVAAIVLCMPIRKALGTLVNCCITHDGLRVSLVLTARVVLSLAILLLSTALLVGATNNAFIYTRF